jgi:hypothetical protein
MHSWPDLKISKFVPVFGSMEPMGLVFALLACAIPLGVILGVTGLIDAGTFLQTVVLVVALFAILAWIRSLFTRRGVLRSGEKTAHDFAPETIIASIQRSNERNPDYLEQLAQRCGRGEHLKNSQDYTQYLMNKASLVHGTNKAICQTPL